MTRSKYSNGMWKTTSRKQDATAQRIFSSFVVKITMSTMFDQESGNAAYHYHLNGERVLSIVVNRQGEIF